MRAVDGGLHKRACDCHARGLFGLALACRVADAHVCKAGILHNAGDIGKVKVNEAGVLYEVRDAGDGLKQNVVRDLESVCERDLLVGRELQPVVGDNKQGVDAAEQLLDTGVCLIHAALALELERLRHNTNSEQTCVTCDLGDDGRCARAGAAAHTGGDERHIGVLNGLGDVVAALLGGALADLRIGACALTSGHLLAYLELLVGIGDRQSLLVRIDCDELNTLSPRLDHSVNNVVAGAANTNDLYIDHVFGPFGFEIHTYASQCIYVA